ncbi:MAG: tetratricopeptide repeat protein, partial [Chloroflexi bacterium]|nr:tetratricopeptide repeat protein [Chloroflexota bacterium]
ADLFTLPNLTALSRETLYQASKVALDAAYALSPLNTDHSANLGRLYRFWAEATANPPLRQERLEQSDRWYANALTLSPNAAHLWTEWGFTKEALGQVEEAIRRYQHAIALDARYVPAFQQLGNLYLNQANARLAAGDRASAASLLEDAANAFGKAVALDPTQPGLLSALGYIYNLQGKTEQAIAANEKVAQLAPNDAKTRLNLALLYRDLAARTNDPVALAKALQEARLALSLAPASDRPAIERLVAELEGRP